MGFRAADPNLYRYVGNSPTNFVDPTGEQAEVSQKPGKYLDENIKPQDYSKNLANSTIPFGTSKATITATLEHWRIDNAVDGAYPSMKFTVSLPATAPVVEKNLLKKAQWFQMAKVDRYKDAEGKMLDNTKKDGTPDTFKWRVYPKEKAAEKDVKIFQMPYGKWFVDSGVLTSPFMSGHDRAQYERTPTSLTFWDGPKGLPTQQHPLFVISLDAYLVIDGIAAYHMSWKVEHKWNNGKPIRVFSHPVGDIPKALPAMLKDRRLWRGPSEGRFDFDYRIRNPITGVPPVK